MPHSNTKLIAYLNLIFILLLISGADSLEDLEKRGQIADTNSSWDSLNFPGFFYDIDNNIGTEKLEVTDLININDQGDYSCNAQYFTKAQPVMFKYNNWGSYYIIGFFGKEYFSGYVESDNPDKNIFFINSPDENPISEKQLLEVLIDDNHEIERSSDLPFELEEGYRINFNILNDSKVFVNLTKDGSSVSSKSIKTQDSSNIIDSTFIYRKKVGDQEDIAIISINIKNVVIGDKQNIISVEGVWQLSESPLKIKEKYDKFDSVRTDANDRSISMHNSINKIILGKGKSTELADNFYIKVSNQTFRYYPFSKYLEPGNYEIRSTVAQGTDHWNTWNFGGLYYDIDEDIGTENISTRVINSSLSGEKPDYGIIYKTRAQPESFKFEEWGKFKVIGFMGEKFLAGYIKNSTENIFCEDEDINVLSEGKLFRILNDSNPHSTLKNGFLEMILDEGYTLQIKEIDEKGHKLYLELIKDGKIIHKKIISPPLKNSSIKDQTYIYPEKNEGIPLIAIYFKNSFNSPEGFKAATIRGIWQLSEKFEAIRVNKVYDKMTITDIDEDENVITMVNRDQNIRLDRNTTRKITYLPWQNDTNSDISLMKYIKIRTSDSKDLRYYIFNHRIINSTLEIKTDPSGASIDINNNFKGTSPITISVDGGEKNIRIYKEGYEDDVLNYPIKKLNENINRTLKKLKCTLNIVLYPADSELIIDQKPYLNRTILVDRDVNHTIIAKRTGYKDYNRNKTFSDIYETLPIELEKIVKAKEPEPIKFTLSDLIAIIKFIFAVILAIITVMFAPQLQEMGIKIYKKFSKR